MNRIILISKFDILPGVEKDGNIKKCGINTKWELAPLNHVKSEKGYVVIVNKQGNWLKYAKEDINNFFEIKII